MKKFILYLLAFIAITATTFGQETKKDSLPVYIKNPEVPSFNILTIDSTYFSKTDLPKNRPVVIIYFSPDCGHCQYEAKQIVQNMDSLRNAFFIWVSFHPLDQIKQFYKTYGFDKFDNIKIGRDPKYFIPSFYKVEFTPFMAIYNSKGLFTKEFREGAKAEELTSVLQ